MIRFFDREVFYVMYDTLDKSELLACYSKINLDSAACIIDINGKYKGEIFYNGLNNASDVYEAMISDYIVLDDYIWENARQYFKNSVRRTVAIIDKNGKLICHAYDEPAADREIRMLHELMKNSKAVQFPDVFPEYQCVRIYDCNELAYLFAKYLKKLGIRVCFFGKLWKYFYNLEGNEEKEIIPDFTYLNIHAEGTWPKGRNWEENLLRSVSVEFECIDQIYETNSKLGIIQNSFGSCEKLLEKLKTQNEIVIIGSGRAAQDAYDFLWGNGIDICCFMDYDQHEYMGELFGKKIINEADVVKQYKNAVFIECTQQDSAWNDIVDYFDYMGYGRNERFFLLKDYINVQGNSLLNVLKDKKIVLTGHASLCSQLSVNLKKCGITVFGYLKTIEQDIKDLELMEVKPGDIDQECICLIAAYVFSYLAGRSRENAVEKIKKSLKEMGIRNYTDYFCDMRPYIDFEEGIPVKYSHKWLSPRKIILGASESCSGNFFFKELLDGHPSILLIPDISFWNNNLFWLCIGLSGMEVDNILPFFWAWYNEEQEEMYNPTAFCTKMQQLLMKGKRFTSQELFVMFHIAYEYMYGRDIVDVQNMVIYWEPHIFPRDRVEDCVRWLQSETISYEIVNVVRNICPLKGSSLKGRALLGWNTGQTLSQYCITMWNYPPVAKREYHGVERAVIKFEDLKCKPREKLQELCHKWHIEWSETLMKTTKHGQESSYNNGHAIINNFDLRPVYNMYEEYFSEFDRFRMMIIDAPWQRKYGYSYVSMAKFSRRELQELFLKKFRYEDLLEFNNEKEKLIYRVGLLNMFRRKLWQNRVLEMRQNNI